MQRKFLKFKILLIVFCFACGVLPNSYGADFQGEVVKIIDGDSFVVEIGGKSVEVRLYGIDCPEYHQPYSKLAKNTATELVKNKKVQVRSYYTDRYGRSIVLLTVNKQNLNERLVAEGLAWVSPKFCKKKFCKKWKEKQKFAKDTRLGLWRDENPTPPWLWKKMKNKERGWLSSKR